MKVLIQLLSSNESENVQPFHLSSTAVAYVVGDFASMPKQKKRLYNQGLQWDSTVGGTIASVVMVQRGEKYQ